MLLLAMAVGVGVLAAEPLVSDADPPEPVKRLVAAAEAAAEAGNDSEAAANLWRAADLADRGLHEYARALALYDRLAQEYPAARLARAASARGEYVRKGISGGEEPFRRFETVRAEFARMPRHEARRRVRSIVEEFPSFPLLDEVLLWLGDRALEEGDTAEARAHYQALARGFPESPLAAHAWAGLGRAAFDAGEYAAAEEAYARIAGTTLAGAELVSRKEREVVRRHRLRARRLRGVLAFLGLAGVLAVASLDPRRLPAAVRASAGRELLYAAPVFGLLVLIAPPEGRAAIAAVAGLGVAFLWAALVWAGALRPAFARSPARAAATALGTLSAAALFYVVLYALDLLVAVERLLGGA